MSEAWIEVDVWDGRFERLLPALASSLSEPELDCPTTGSVADALKRAGDAVLVWLS